MTGPTPASTNTVWDWTPVSDHTSVIEEFDDFGSGWTHQLTTGSTELEIFEDVFCPAALNLCITETNRFADQTGDCLTKRWENWKAVTSGELMRFFAIRIIMGINKKPEMKQYWSRDEILKQPLIPKLMSQDRYFEILKNLHFSDNQTQMQGDRIFKLRKIWEICTSKFQDLIVPNKCLSIDESLVLHKGRLYFKQYIPSKRSRFGIKTFSIVDEETKFIVNSIVYAGKNHELKFSTKDFGYGGAIALELMEPYFNKNHHLYCDNWFVSPILAEELLSRNTYVCGTLRKNRKHIPLMKEKLKRGEIKVFTSNNIMVEYWKDNKIVRMISTMHDHEMRRVRTRHSAGSIEKPISVLNYNQFARGKF